MEKPIKITAVCGWAISPGWFRDLVKEFFPNGEVRAIYPSRPADSEEARQLLVGGECHLYIGYSLGSLWLLHHRQYLSQRAHKALLAPILDFTLENKMGGKTPAGQLKYLIKSLKNNSGNTALLNDFYSRCEFSLHENFFREIPDWPTLVRGLEFLDSIRVKGETAKDFSAIMGDDDPLLDGSELMHHIPHLEIVKDAGHAPDKLLQRLARCLAW